MFTRAHQEVGVVNKRSGERSILRCSRAVKSTGSEFLWRVVFEDDIEDIEASPSDVFPLVNPYEAVMASDHSHHHHQIQSQRRTRNPTRRRVKTKEKM